MEEVKVAVATSDRLRVDTHFGKAERFSIYTMGRQVRFIEERGCEKLSVDDPAHAFDPSKFERIAGVLHDCKKVYVADIGPVPRAALQARGIEVVRCQCPIDQIGRCGCTCSSLPK